MNRTGRFAVLAGLLMTGVSACGESETRAAIERDSAGVQIVENRRPVWDAGSEWRLSDEPVLRIGSDEADPGHVFDAIVGALFLPDGSIVVADDGYSNIRRFDNAERLEWTVGARGEGPREFTTINAIGHAGPDSIWVYDFSLRRITYVDLAGGIGDMVTLEDEIPRLGAVGRFADGSFVLAQYWGSAGPDERVESGLVRHPIVFARFDADGSVADTLGMYPGREVHLVTEEGRMRMGAPPFGRDASRALSVDRLFIGDQVSVEYGEYAADGTLVRLVRAPTGDLQVTEDDVERWIEDVVEQSPSSIQAALRRNFDETVASPLRPAYLRFLPDSEGHLWVSAYASPTRQPTRWDVFDQDGYWLGTVTIPERFEVLDVSGTRVVGVWRDAFDVPHLTVYQLIKSDDA